MRVVHLVRSSWPAVGGLEASVHGLARAQHALGLQVVVAAPGAREVVFEGVRYRRLRRLGPRRYPGALGIRRVLSQADVVHVHGLDLLADVAVRLHPRVGVSTHGGYFHHDRHRLLKRVVMRLLTAPTLRRARAVWYTSRADQLRLAACGVEGEVVGNGIDLAGLGRDLRPVPGRWVVPGRVDGHKGHLDLLEAIATMPRSGPRELRVVGPVADQEVAVALRARGAVVTGALEREAYLDELCQADRVICPSRSEGFGIAALEVMAMGVPLVLSDIPAHRELDPCSGPRVDLRGAGAGLALEQAARLAPERCAARQQAASAHSWGQVARRVVAAYEAMS